MRLPIPPSGHGGVNVGGLSLFRLEVNCLPNDLCVVQAQYLGMCTRQSMDRKTAGLVGGKRDSTTYEDRIGAPAHALVTVDRVAPAGLP